MTALIIIGSILAFFILISLIRVGAAVTYGESVLCIKIVAAFLKITIYPLENKEKKKKPKKDKKEKKDAKKPSEETADGNAEEEKPKKKLKLGLKDIKALIDVVLDALGRLRHKLSIDKLTVHYTVASDNPFSAAMTYGYINAGIGALLPSVEKVFKIKKRDIQVGVTFDSPDSIIYADAQLTLAIWEIIYIALAVVPAIKIFIKKSENGKVEKDNGKTSDK